MRWTGGHFRTGYAVKLPTPDIIDSAHLPDIPSAQRVEPEILPERVIWWKTKQLTFLQIGAIHLEWCSIVACCGDKEDLWLPLASLCAKVNRSQNHWMLSTCPNSWPPSESQDILKQTLKKRRVTNTTDKASPRATLPGTAGAETGCLVHDAHTISDLLFKGTPGNRSGRSQTPVNSGWVHP